MSHWVPALDNFDASEERAWLSGQRLERLFASRSTIFNVVGSSKLWLYGHGMGNVVATEALRMAAANGIQNPVKTYISAQAAISSAVWNSTAPLMTEWQAAIILNPLSYTPDVFAHYWANGESNTHAQGWVAYNTPSYAAVGSMPSQVKYVNHYNARDYALKNWKINTTLKPNATFGYSTVLDHYHTDLGFTTLTCPTDRYRIFSYAAPSHTYATGAESIAFSGIMNSISINIDFRFSFGQAHKGHSGQFRSNVQKRWSYWTEAFSNIQ